MPTSFQAILNSRLFKFVVGEEIDGTATEFSVHEDAIAQLSKPLNTLTKGLSEARAGRVAWKDVSKETFERFAQFAYTGDYSVPKTEKRGISTPTPASPKTPNGIRKRHGSEASASTVEPNEKFTPAFENELGREPVPEKVDVDDSGTILNYPSLSSKKNKKKKKAQAAQVAQTKVEPTIELEPEVSALQPNPEQAEPNHVEPQALETETAGKGSETTAEPAATSVGEKDWEPGVDFYLLSYPLLAERDNYHGTCEPSSEFEKENSYSKVLLCHASLYVLGDFQLIDSLRALALFKLHKTLCAFQLDKENITDITDLARYAYSEEGKGFDAGIGGLRALVCQYMAMHAQELAGDNGFMNLLAEGGQIVKDFFKFQLQRKN